MQPVEEITVRDDTTVRSTIQHMTESRSGYVIVVDEEDRFAGLVADGDIRRALLDGLDLDSPISTVMNEDPVVATTDMPPEERRELATFRYRVIPVLDDDRRVVDAIFYQETEGSRETDTPRTAVVGLGFVGLTLAVSLAEAGCRVTGVDKDPSVLAALEKGEPPFHEKALDLYLERHLGNRLNVTDELEGHTAETYIIAVGTPLDDEQEPVLDYVKSAARSVGEAIKVDDLVILRSTVPVGTTRDVVAPILEETSGLTVGEDFGLVFAPERTVAGRALEEIRELPQIIGAYDEPSLEAAVRLFNRFAKILVRVDSLEAAELAKLIDNSYRDHVFAYANQISNLCEELELDMMDLVDAVNVGYDRNQVPIPSPGVGGACLSKDPYILASVGRSAGAKLPLVEGARRVNEAAPNRMADKVLDRIHETGKDPSDCVVHVLGFAFKGRPETSDTRGSPTRPLVEKLLKAGCTVRGYDPVVETDEIRSFGAEPVGLEEGFEGADAVVIMTNHREFETFNPFRLLPRMNLPAAFLDGWQLFKPEDIKSVPGIVYGGVGHN